MSLAIVCSHFNPAGYQESRRNLLRFLRQLQTQKIPVYVAELVYDQEFFFVPDEFTPFRFRTTRDHILWHKENLINLAVERIPDCHNKIAWIDPDVWFMDPEWFFKAEEALDNRAILQLFSQAAWTDRSGRLIRHMKGCASQRVLNLRDHHPGFAWAARRELWSHAGGLCDHAILGGADTLVVASCLNVPLPELFHYPRWKDWLEPMEQWIRQNGGLGFLDGLLIHEWHGEEAGRDYRGRHEILSGIDIDQIIQKRDDGLLTFSAKASYELCHKISTYFQKRAEDG